MHDIRNQHDNKENVDQNVLKLKQYGDKLFK